MYCVVPQYIIFVSGLPIYLVHQFRISTVGLCSTVSHCLLCRVVSCISPKWTENDNSTRKMSTYQWHICKPLSKVRACLYVESLSRCLAKCRTCNKRISDFGQALVSVCVSLLVSLILRKNYNEPGTLRTNRSDSFHRSLHLCCCFDSAVTQCHFTNAITREIQVVVLFTTVVILRVARLLLFVVIKLLALGADVRDEMYRLLQ